MLLLIILALSMPERRSEGLITYLVPTAIPAAKGLFFLSFTPTGSAAKGLFFLSFTQTGSAAKGLFFSSFSSVVLAWSPQSLPVQSRRRCLCALTHSLIICSPQWRRPGPFLQSPPGPLLGCANSHFQKCSLNCTIQCTVALCQFCDTQRQYRRRVWNRRFYSSIFWPCEGRYCLWLRCSSFVSLSSAVRIYALLSCALCCRICWIWASNYWHIMLCVGLPIAVRWGQMRQSVTIAYVYDRCRRDAHKRMCCLLKTFTLIF